MTRFIFSLIVGIVAMGVISWLLTCGIIKLITMCFGLTFSWGVATGVWLVLLLLKNTFKTIINK